MPGTQELVGLLFVIFAVWFLLKLAKLAVRLIFLMIAAVMVVGALYWLFAR
jgi:hypothetical protein